MHHIRPLGDPHGGSDVVENMLIVCPNHHKMLDYGAMEIMVKKLLERRHEIDAANIDYHNVEIFAGTEILPKDRS